MAGNITIRLDTEKYMPPTQDDIKAAKQYVLDREENAVLLSQKIDAILEDASERIVTICYKYGIDPKRLHFSARYNMEMMAEISDVMDEAAEEILDLIYEYSAKATNDDDSRKALIAWMALLGRGNNNLRDTLYGYLQKTMKDWEAAIAAMKSAGLTLSEAVIRIKTYLHHIYEMPEVLDAFRKSGEYDADLIRSRGVTYGAVGLSNNGSTNVTNMAKITLQMAWMKAKFMEIDSDRQTEGVYILRGSAYDCPVCDSHVGFHTKDSAMRILPVHPHCKCYCVPIRGIGKED